MCLHTNSAELCINFAYCMCNVYANLRWIIIFNKFYETFQLFMFIFWFEIENTFTYIFIQTHFFVIFPLLTSWLSQLQIRSCLIKITINCMTLICKRLFLFHFTINRQKESKCFSSCTLVSTRSLVEKG